MPFNLTEDDFEIPKECPALGIRLYSSSSYATDHSPSLDRIIPGLGYVAGNVVVVSHLANRIKSNAAISQIRAVADYFENLINTKD